MELDLPQGTLDLLISKTLALERRGWIRAQWDVSDNNRRAKYYDLTKRGRARLEVEISAWRTLSHAVAQVIESV
jgi:DNA-binding PadR family transcriptional regulator